MAEAAEAAMAAMEAAMQRHLAASAATSSDMDHEDDLMLQQVCRCPGPDLYLKCDLIALSPAAMARGEVWVKRWQVHEVQDEDDEEGDGPHGGGGNDGDTYDDDMDDGYDDDLLDGDSDASDEGDRLRLQNMQARPADLAPCVKSCLLSLCFVLVGRR